MALLTRAAPVVGCGAIISVGNPHAHGAQAAVADALAARLAERTGVPRVTVPDLAAASGAAAAIASPLVCVAVDRHGVHAVRDLSVPVLVVGPHCDPARDLLEGELLACLDGSMRAEAVLPTAASWAGALGLELWLLYAISLADAAEMNRHPGPADVLQNGYLARLVAGLGPGAVAGWDVLHGSPAPALVDHARHSRASLLALNTHGVSTSARSSCGRVPARVVLESPVPVLLTPTRETPVVPPVPRLRPAPAPRLHPTRPRPVALPRRDSDGDGVAVAARSYLSVTVRRGAVARPPARRWSRRTALVAVGLACAVFAAFAARVPLPYHRLGGATRPATALVSVSGLPVDRTAGTILVTVVTSKPVTLAGAVRAWIDRSSDVLPDQSGPAAYDVKWTNQHLMTEAGRTATTVALHQLRLDGADVRVTVTPHGLGGPSAGLAMALEMVDLLSPGDLTHGHVVAVSGALDRTGSVGAVGGIRYKAAAARRAGADVLLVPTAMAAEATLYATGVRVIPVATFAEALAVLRSL